MFGIISQIDDFYAKSLKNSFFMKVLKESEIEIHSTDEDKKKSVECNSNFLYSILHYSMIGFYRAVKILYSSFYFYFAPYTVIVLSVYHLDYS
jgi:hypothetical protein